MIRNIVFAVFVLLVVMQTPSFANSDTGCSVTFDTMGQDGQSKIHVYGDADVFTDGSILVVSRADPQGYNPHILLLNIHVIEVPGPKKGTRRAFEYVEYGMHVHEYHGVQVAGGGFTCSSRGISGEESGEGDE